MTFIHRMVHAGRRLAARVLYRGNARHCLVCGSGVRVFRPLDTGFARQSTLHGFPYDLRRFETLNVDEYECPLCGESDRARLMALWLRDWTARRDPSSAWRLLDFAPGRGLARFLRMLPGVVYRSADMFMAGVDDRVDITRMSYADGSFDGVICSHVLEHVSDDRLALKELHRVLAPGGWALLLVPIPLGLERSDEEVAGEAGTATDASRWSRFGQGDHVRLYARGDFIQRIRGAGFTCDEFSVSHLIAQERLRLGLSPTSILYVARKP